MTLKIALLGATALGLLVSTSAYAVMPVTGGNTTNLSQSGSANSASVDQSGGSGNFAGDASHVVTQTGASNVLVITQTGSGNYVDRDNPLDPDKNPSAGSVTGSASQSVSTASSGHNTATIDQESTSTVGSGVDNTVAILYQVQNGVGNDASVTQTGSNNWVSYLDQESSSLGASAGSTTNNSITAVFTGNGNGRDSTLDESGVLSGTFAHLSGATTGRLRQVNETSTGATASVLNQGAAGNVINLEIDGNNNQYGMTQKGDANTTGLVKIVGSSNQFGSYQTGKQNVINTGTISGSFNDIGIWQSGTSNSATVNSLGLGGSNNEIGILQSGTSNIGSITVDGSTNQAEIEQFGTNTATIKLEGSSNGSGTFSSLASGAAGSLVSAHSTQLSDGLIQQGTSLVSTTGDIASYTVYGDSNQFAIAQLGDDDTVTGTVGTSSAGGTSSNNYAAVLQTGASNTATFNQTGTGGNVVSVHQ